MDFRDLRSVDLPSLVDAFNDAFSDYVLPMHATVEGLADMFRRRGYDASLSVGAFDGDRIAGFVFNAIDGREAYNTGTGVGREWRHRGVGRQLMQHAIEAVRGRADRYILEVIATNARAERLYRDVGFELTRTMTCWTYEPRREVILPRLDDWNTLESQRDVEPSWQNRSASVRRTLGAVVLGDERGYVIVFPATGDVPQLVVHREHRRVGLGRDLLDAAATVAGKTLRIINVDERDAGIAAFMEHIGAKLLIRQLEMIRALGR